MLHDRDLRIGPGRIVVARGDDEGFVTAAFHAERGATEGTLAEWDASGDEAVEGGADLGREEEPGAGVVVTAQARR
jgi:hypothetical protein